MYLSSFDNIDIITDVMMKHGPYLDRKFIITVWIDVQKLEWILGGEVENKVVEFLSYEVVADKLFKFVIGSCCKSVDY